MNITIKKLTDKTQTSNEIRRLAYSYFTDLDKLLQLDLHSFFNYVKNIPYQIDTAPIEVVKRAKYILQDRKADCKKKTILCISYFIYHKINYRLIGTSNRETQIIHHIFPQIQINNKWLNFDATYPRNKIFQPKKNLTNAVIL